MTNEWLQALKPGDEVAVSEGGIGQSYRIDRVDRIAKSGRIVTKHTYNGREIETQFRPSGQEAKAITRSSPYSDELCELTQDIRDAIEFKRLWWKVSKVDYGKLALDQLRRIEEIVKEPKA